MKGEVVFIFLLLGLVAGVPVEQKNQTANLGTPKQQQCASCSPRDRPSSLPLVVPFYSKDLCKVQLLARGVAAHDTNQIISTVNLIWTDSKPLSEFSNAIEGIKSDLASKNVRILQHEDLPGTGWSNKGWHLQQQVKIRAQEILPESTTHFLVLDSKNVMINSLSMSSLFDECGKVIEYDLAANKLHDGWGQSSAAVLDLHVDHDVPWPSSVTPVVFHIPTLKAVSSLLASKGLGLETALAEGATEFMLYRSYVRSNEHKEECQCTHSLRDDSNFEKKNQMRATFFETSTAEESRKRMLDIVGGSDKPVFFGSQRQFQKSELAKQDVEFVKKSMGQIYANAGLVRETDSQEIKDGCFAV